MVLISNRNDCMSDSLELSPEQLLPTTTTNGARSSSPEHGRSASESSVPYDRLPLADRHAVFNSPFARHCHDEDWPAIVAEETGWTRQQVEEHAYQYLLAIIEVEQQQESESIRREQSNEQFVAQNSPLPNDDVHSESIKSPGNNSTHSPQRSDSPLPWTIAELALLETAMARYRPMVPTATTVISWEEEIAEHFPWRYEREVISKIGELVEETQAEDENSVSNGL